MFLSPGSVDENSQLMQEASTQGQVHKLLFFLSVIMILWLMIAEPVYEIRHMKKHPEESHDKASSDIIVQQIIHTIEYVLGCISHTASYLRLWALSLAHSQLAEVFFDQMLGVSLNQTNPIMGGISLLITYPMFFGASMVILCAMEALSAFLHGLRLAWIEFNSKFFVAEGYLFEPMQIEKTHGIIVSAAMTRD